MLAAAAMSTLFTLPTSSFLTSQDFSGCSRFFSRRKIEGQHARRARPSVTTARIELKPPPYSLNALEPHLNHETLEYHWGKHHKTYVENLNKQIVGTELDDMALEDIILATYNKGNLLPPFNNAAQAWNHDFFWESMQPGGGGKPSGDLLDIINRDFGSFDGFLNEFKAAAGTQFGSGWAWLVYKANKLNVGNAVNPVPSDEDKKLVVVKSPNAVNPLVWDYCPLLTIDVWEHAYYLDFQNRRSDYIATFMEKLVSWETVSSRLVAAKARTDEREREEKRMMEEVDQTTDDEDEEVYLDSDRENSEDEA